MAESIKGLSVKIGADTSDFIKGLKKVDKEITATNKVADQLQKGLQLEFDEGRFIEAQRLIQQSLQDTEDKAEAIRKQLKFLEDSGAVDTEGYKKLQTELYKAENSAILLKQKLEDVNNVKTTGIVDKVKNLVTNLKTGTVVAGAVAGAIYKIGKTSAEAGANIQDLADRLGLTAEQVQRYDYIALQSGLTTEELSKSIAKSRDAIGTALAGTSNTATQALQTLFGDLSQIPKESEAGFTSIIEKLSQVEDSTLQAYYANEIFGERLATNLLPMINNGSEKLSQLNEEFETLGYLSNEEVQQLADLDDNFNKVQKKVQNLTYQLGTALAPVIELVISLLEPVLSLLQQIMEILTPVIDFISVLADKMLTLGFATTLGKGWLWGSDKDKEKLKNVFTTWGEPESYNETTNNYTTPTTTSNNNNVSNYEDNSTTNVDINLNASGDLNYDAKTLADEVIKQIATRKQASGR